MARPLTPPATDVELRAAWRLGDAALEADAIAFWQRLGLLPPDVSPAARAKELVALAYRDGAVAGLMTATVQHIDAVRARLAMIRAAVDPAQRQTHVVMALLLFARQTLADWSRDHPAQKVAGLGAVLESRELELRQRQAFWPQSKLGLAGYTADGRQFRISWFEDFELD